MLVYKIGDIENRAALQWIEIIFLETGLHPRIAFTVPKDISESEMMNHFTGIIL